MGWQERIWEKVSRAGDWPKQMMEIVCMLTALPFFLSALIYDYFPFFFMGAAFTVVAWLAEEKRLAEEPRLIRRTWAMLKRSALKPWWTVTAVAIIIVGLWREAVWVALLGMVVLRGGVRRSSRAVPPDEGSAGG
jgi:hypothetical protein